MKKIAIAVVAAATLVTSSVAPAISAPFGRGELSVPGSTVENVQYRPAYRQGYRQGYRHGYYRHGGYHYYNGHRGYNYYRPGYRQYNGWWFPAGAFAAGAIIGGAIAAQQQPSYGGPVSGHVQWCANRYRSYRAYDNTFQPNYGPRQQCVSPY
ncbi:BA14K family protein [Ancylobacter sp. VNQ12]|uniref:BA14K family protein n=1 Tax=Ancylobacter sp. VNQ12 TaxID=3400920 RepID=UPI003C02EEC4